MVLFLNVCSQNTKKGPVRERLAARLYSAVHDALASTRE